MFEGQHMTLHPLRDLILLAPNYQFDSKMNQCQISPHAQFPPACLSMFEPFSLLSSEQCLGVWPCRLIEISAPSPLNGDLVLGDDWLHLFLNTTHGVKVGRLALLLFLCRHSCYFISNIYLWSCSLSFFCSVSSWTLFMVSKWCVTFVGDHEHAWWQQLTIFSAWITQSVIGKVVFK